MLVTVPTGVAPGQMLQVSTPAGQQMQVAVPAGVSEGQQFQVQIPETAVVASPQVMSRDLPPGVPPGCTLVQDKYWGPTSQVISLVLCPVAGCICPCLCPCDTRDAYLIPDGRGAKYVDKDECSHCGMGKCAGGTWQYEAPKKGPSGGGL